MKLMQIKLIYENRSQSNGCLGGGENKNKEMFQGDDMLIWVLFTWV